MQKLMLLDQMKEVQSQMDEKVLNYLWQGKTETFEGFADFYLLAFDWYDVSSPETGAEKILIYLDREDLFFFCEDARSLNRAREEAPEGLDNESALYQFFANLLKSDTDALDAFEAAITEDEDSAMVRTGRYDYMDRIVGYRKELLRRKRYYEQLVAIFENLADDDEKLLTRNAQRHFSNLQNRAERFLRTVLSLREYVTQMREAYQAQIDLQQNELMRLFTVITALFLPLTLLVGWYGMNFQWMPELTWKYGYPAVIGLSVLISAGLLLWFKWKHWL